MAFDPAPESSRTGRLATAALALLFAAICLGPWLPRLKHPTLYSDDVARIGYLHTHSLSEGLFRPFNEHMAPVFEVVTWTTWRLAGHRLTQAPLAFTLVSYLPFVLCLLVLGAWLRRELSSTTTALAAVALFGLSNLYAETVFWYSASSFTWALLGTLAVLVFAGEASRSSRPVGWLSGASLASALAPACSGLGLLAGPVGAIRLCFADESDPRLRRRNRFAAALPLAGSFLYLAVCSVFRYREVLRSSIERHLDLGMTLEQVVRTPITVLLPGLIGLRPPREAGLPLAVVGIGSGLAVTSVLVWAARRPSVRPLVLGGLWLILGGYALTFSLRATQAPDHIHTIQRYHLFPQLGLVLILAPALRGGLGRWDHRPQTAWLAAIALAAALLVVQKPQFEHRARYLRFPEQRATLEALERLDQLCRRHQITRSQALAALDPLHLRWYPHGFNALELLPDSVATPGLPDEQVRPTLLAALSASDREALCGGMDVSPYVQVVRAPDASDIVAMGRLVDAFRMHPLDPTGTHFDAEGWPSYLEFQMTAPPGPSPAHAASAAAEARVLCLPGGPLGTAVEIWWAGPDDRWSSGRSVRWRYRDTAQTTDSAAATWAVPLERLPHWDPTHAQRIRLLFETAGPVAVGAPRLVR